MYRWSKLCWVLVSMVFVSAHAMDDDEIFEEFAAQESSPISAPQRPEPMPLPQTPSAGNQAAAPLKWQQLPGDKSGVTTINEARGNWFFKAQILKDARKVYNSILKKVNAIAPLQEKFIGDHAAVNQLLLTFNQEFGFSGGEIDERMNMLLAQIKEYTESAGTLDQEGQAFLAELNAKKEDIEAFKKEFEKLQKLDNALSQGLATVASQLTRANNYEEQAWHQYEKIEEILNDEQAEELLNKMQLAFDNVIAIETYLTEQFRIFFATTIEQIKQQVQVVKNHIIALKAKGIAMGEKMRALQEKEDEERRVFEEQQTRERIAKEQKSKRTWLSPIFDTISWLWEMVRDSIAGAYNWVMSWFKSKPANSVEKCPVQKEIEIMEEELKEEPVEEMNELEVPESSEQEVLEEEVEMPASVMPQLPELTESILPEALPIAPIQGRPQGPIEEKVGDQEAPMDMVESAVENGE